MRRASAKVRHGNELSNTQCSGSSTPSGACTSCTSTTHTPRKGSCQPPGRHGPSKSTCTLRSSTIAVRAASPPRERSEEHTSELQSHSDLVCRLLLEKKKK